MELLLAYGAGLLTLINPCVLPILPIVLASASAEDRMGPVYLAFGMSVSFIFFGVTLTAVGYSIGFTTEDLAQVGAWLMLAFGLLLVVPQSTPLMTRAFAGIATSADRGIDRVGGLGPLGQVLGGGLLGLVWSPCIGPTLGGAIALASQGQSLVWATLIMTGFSLGVSTIILALSFGTREILRTRQDTLRHWSIRSKPILGAAFIVVGAGLILNIHHMLEAWALSVMPTWLIDLSVRI